MVTCRAARSGSVSPKGGGGEAGTYGFARQERTDEAHA